MLTEKHIYEIAKKFPQHLKDPMTMSAVITLWELLTEYQTMACIMDNSGKLTWLPMDFISKDKHIVIHPECGPAGVTATNLAETDLQGISRFYTC